MYSLRVLSNINLSTLSSQFTIDILFIRFVKDLPVVSQTFDDYLCNIYFFRWRSISHFLELCLGSMWCLFVLPRSICSSSSVCLQSVYYLFILTTFNPSFLLSLLRNYELSVRTPQDHSVVPYLHAYDLVYLFILYMITLSFFNYQQHRSVLSVCSIEDQSVFPHNSCALSVCPVLN